jgi:hypothetical protein
MSNCLKQPRVFLSEASQFIAQVDYCYFTEEEQARLSTPKQQREHRSPDYVKDCLKDSRTEFKESIYLDNRCRDAGIMQMQLEKKVLATAACDGRTMRPREHTLVAATTRAVLSLKNLREFMEGTYGPAAFTFADVLTKIKNTQVAQCGAQGSLGRIRQYLPKKQMAADARPITAEEAQAALVAMGLPSNKLLNDVEPKKLTMEVTGVVGVPNEDSVEVNAEASSGFPRLTNFKKDLSGEILADALHWLDVLQTKWDTLRSKGVRERHMLFQEYLALMRSRLPLDFLCRGKVKTDPYSKEKIIDNKLRFYNVLPRHFVLIMQMGAQALEASAQCLTASPASNNAQGLALVRGGADALVQTLDERLMSRDFVYAHCGDDTWCVYRWGTRIFLFALDCSAFDLTQDGRVTLAVHDALRQAQACVHEVSAELWYFFIRTRLVAVAGSCITLWHDAGPSGTPNQSKVNGMLMEVCLGRLNVNLEAMRKKCLERTGTSDPPDSAEAFGLIESCIQAAGASMSFKVRIEQTVACEAETVRQVLLEKHFLFIGYYFWTDPEHPGYAVRCYMDMPRALSQLPYPEKSWVKNKDDLAARVALKLTGVALACGYAPPQLRAPIDSLLQSAAKALSSVKRRLGELTTEDLQSIPEFVFAGQGPETIRKILDSQEAVSVADFARDLWLGKPEAASTTETEAPDSDHPDAVADWYEQTQEEGRAKTVALCGEAYAQAAGGTSTSHVRLAPRPVQLRTASAANFGRAPTETRVVKAAKPELPTAPKRAAFGAKQPKALKRNERGRKAGKNKYVVHQDE